MIYDTINMMIQVYTVMHTLYIIYMMHGDNRHKDRVDTNEETVNSISYDNIKNCSIFIPGVNCDVFNRETRSKSKPNSIYRIKLKENGGDSGWGKRVKGNMNELCDNMYYIDKSINRVRQSEPHSSFNKKAGKGDIESKKYYRKEYYGEYGLSYHHNESNNRFNRNNNISKVVHNDHRTYNEASNSQRQSGYLLSDSKYNNDRPIIVSMTSRSDSSMNSKRSNEGGDRSMKMKLIIRPKKGINSASTNRLLNDNARRSNKNNNTGIKIIPVSQSESFRFHERLKTSAKSPKINDITNVSRRINFGLKRSSSSRSDVKVKGLVVRSDELKKKRNENKQKDHTIQLDRIIKRLDSIIIKNEDKHHNFDTYDHTHDSILHIPVYPYTTTERRVGDDISKYNNGK